MRKSLVLLCQAVAVSVSAALLLPLLTIQSALPAERVGVAAAVTPAATSQPPGGSATTLKIGKAVVYNERIDTSGAGVVQVLLLDGSTFTVGPGSSLVIDKFVYDPRSGNGALVASFSKGALRFVGGKLSKDEHGIKVKTPAGVLTVRGGIFQGVVSGPNRALFAFTFGNYLSLLRGGRLATLKQTGMVFAVAGPGPAAMRQATAADINFILASVSGKKTKFATTTIKVKGKSWPYYYGIQPTGIYPDQPFIKQLYYDTAAGDIARSSLRAVPIPEIAPPRIVVVPVGVPTPPPPVVVVQPPVIVPTIPPPGGPCTSLC
jgi:hypothetical protein